MTNELLVGSLSHARLRRKDGQAPRDMAIVRKANIFIGRDGEAYASGFPVAFGIECMFLISDIIFFLGRFWTGVSSAGYSRVRDLGWVQWWNWMQVFLLCWYGERKDLVSWLTSWFDNRSLDILALKMSSLNVGRSSAAIRIRALESNEKTDRQLEERA